MSIQQELGFRSPLRTRAHEALLNVVLTGALLTKTGDRVLRAYGLTVSQFNVLMLLKYQSGGEGITQTQLGQMLFVNRSNVTGVVDRMEDAGWVRRGSEEGDRRVKPVAITAAGHSLLEQAEKVYFARVQEVMGCLSNDEHQRLCHMLERLRSILRGAREAGK